MELYEHIRLARWDEILKMVKNQSNQGFALEVSPVASTQSTANCVAPDRNVAQDGRGARGQLFPSIRPVNTPKSLVSSELQLGLLAGRVIPLCRNGSHHQHTDTHTRFTRSAGCLCAHSFSPTGVINFSANPIGVRHHIHD